jgi:hypothetical protein
MADSDNLNGKIHSYELFSARTRLALLQHLLPQDNADPTEGYYAQIRESLGSPPEVYGTHQLSPTQEMEQDIAIQQIMDRIISIVSSSLAVGVKVEKDASLPIEEAFVPYLFAFLELKSQLSAEEQGKIRQIIEELEQEEDEEEKAEIAYDQQESEHLLELVLQGIEEIDEILDQIAEEVANNDLEAAKAIIDEYLSVPEEIEPELFREVFVRPPKTPNPSNENTVADDADAEEIALPAAAVQHN